MHVGLQRLQPFLVSDAESLFFIDDDEPEAFEIDRFGEHRMGADDNVDRTFGQSVADRFRFAGGDQPRKAADVERKAFEARGEIVVMLPCEQGRRAHHRYLQPGHRRDERRAQRDLRLAETDIADDQPVHRPASREIAQYIGDRAILIVRLGEGEAIDEAGIGAVIGLGDLAGTKGAFGGNRDELTRNFADALLHPALAPLPSFAAQPIEAGAVFARSVARQHVDILDRDVELVAAGIFQRDAIVRALTDRDRGQPLVAADAMIDMDDKVAGRERGELGKKRVRRFTTLGATHQPIAKHVLLGQQRDVRGGEAVVERQHDQRDMRIRLAKRRLPALGHPRILQAVIAEQAGQPLARPVGIARQDGFLVFFS